eukprot:tig00001284_g8009.t1
MSLCGLAEAAVGLADAAVAPSALPLGARLATRLPCIGLFAAKGWSTSVCLTTLQCFMFYVTMEVSFLVLSFFVRCVAAFSFSRRRSAACAAGRALSAEARIAAAMLRVGKLTTSNDIDAIKRKNLDAAYYLPPPRFDICTYEWVATGPGEDKSELVYRRNAPGGFGGGDRPVVLFLHGGGFFSGHSRMYSYFLGSLAEALGADVLAPNYRLAPAHKWPAPLHDCLDAYRWLVEARGVDPARILLVGDSAGGGLCAHLAAAIAQGRVALPMPRAAVLISPFLDVSFSFASFHTHRKRDPFLKVDEVLAKVLVHEIVGIPPEAVSDPAVMPASGPLAGPGGRLCPLLVFVGSEEVLVDDVRVFAARAEAAGVEADLHVAEGLFHVYPCLYPRLPESRDAMEQMRAFAKRVWAAPPPPPTAPRGASPAPSGAAGRAPPLVVELDGVSPTSGAGG